MKQFSRSKSDRLFVFWLHVLRACEKTSCSVSWIISSNSHSLRGRTIEVEQFSKNVRHKWVYCRVHVERTKVTQKIPAQLVRNSTNNIIGSMEHANFFTVSVCFTRSHQTKSRVLGCEFARMNRRKFDWLPIWSILNDYPFTLITGTRWTVQPFFCSHSPFARITGYKCQSQCMHLVDLCFSTWSFTFVHPPFWIAVELSSWEWRWLSQYESY